MRCNTSHDLRLVEITNHRTYKISSLHNVLLDLDWSTCEMRYLHQDVLPRNKTRAHRQIMSSSHYIIRSLQEPEAVFVMCSAWDWLRKEEQLIRIDKLNCYSTQGTATEVIQQRRYRAITGIRRQKGSSLSTAVHRNHTKMSSVPFPATHSSVWQWATYSPSDRPEAEAIMKSTSESSCTAIVTGIHLSLRHSNIPWFTSPTACIQYWWTDSNTRA